MMRRRTTIAVAMALTATACATSDPSATRSDATVTAMASETPVDDASPRDDATEGREAPGRLGADVPDPGSARVTLVEVGNGFEQPVAILQSPADGALLVVEQPGRITTLDGQVRLDLSDLTLFRGERGLLDAVFHPDGTRIFVHHSGRDGETVLAEYPVAADGTVDATSRDVLFTTPQPAANHNGGSIVFTPDGLLVLALGDGGRAGDAFHQGQDTSTPLGGLLRLDVSTPGAATPAGGASFEEPRLWMYGLRNPWRIDVDEGRLFVADVGQDAVEEVSVVSLEDAGANFGWPLKEGDVCYEPAPCDGDFVVPIVTEEHRDGSCSITGGVVHRGASIPELVGTYLYSDLCGGYLRGVLVDGLDVVATVDLSGQVDVSQVVAFGTDDESNTYLLQLGGEVLRLEPA